MATRSKSAPPVEAEPETTEAPEEPPTNAVLVLIERDENGNIATDVQTVGDVRVTEVDTILEIGWRGWREKIGLATR